jgi:hypothetical protein
VDGQAPAPVKRALAIAAIVVACNPPPATRQEEVLTPVPAKARFRIQLAHGRHIDALPYEWDERWSDFVRTAPLERTFVDEDDVERYVEAPAALVLTEEASRRVARDRATERQFVVTLGDERLFGGTIQFIGSARAIAYPVIYVDDRAPRLVLWIHPRHSGVYDPPAFSPELWARVARPQVLAHFEALGKLAKAPEAGATSFDAALAAVDEAETLEARDDVAGALAAAGRALTALGADYAAGKDDTPRQLATAIVAREAGDGKRAATMLLDVARTRVAMYRERHPDAARDPRVLRLRLEIDDQNVATVVLENAGGAPVLVNGRMAVNSSHAPRPYREVRVEVTGPRGERHGSSTKVRIGAPGAGDAVLLAPGESRSATIDLVRSHGLVEPGSYEARAYYASAPLADPTGKPVWTGETASEPVRFTLRR